MKEITEDEVKKIFSLSRLNAPEGSLKVFCDEFNDILAFFSALQEVDTSSTEEMTHVHDATNVFREDDVVSPLSLEKALQNSPEKDPEFFSVPLVVED